MAGLLARELTPEEQKVAAWLEEQVQARTGRRDAAAAIRQAARQATAGFAAGALAALERLGEPDRRWLYAQLMEDSEFLLQLIDPAHLDRKELATACRGLMALDGLFDVRLARLTPRRAEGPAPPPEAVLRVLEVLDQITVGGRLILLLNHLTEHPDPRVVSRATLLIGKRLRSREWLARQSENPDGRVRASTVESLWGSSTAAARARLWAALEDPHNRVVANALVGLHQIGEAGVPDFVKRMIEDPRPPFRWAAAWVMGRLGAGEFIEYLERALHDRNAQVRRAAERALHSILSAAPPEAAATPPEAQPPAPTLPPERKPASPEFYFRFDGKYITRVSRP